LILPLTENWRIATDPMNFIVQKGVVRVSGKEAGTVRWSNVAYCGTLCIAFNSFIKHSMLQSNVSSLEELKELLVTIAAKIEEIKTSLANLGSTHEESYKN